MTSTTERPVCAECGNFSIGLEAFVSWDTQKGEAAVDGLCDKGHSCDNCGHGVRLEWIDTKHTEVTLPELDTIIAALRFWQSYEMHNPEIGRRRGHDEFVIASEHGDPISTEAIDALIERLNE